MQEKYYIAIFGPEAEQYRRTLKRQIRKRLSELGDTLTEFVGFLTAHTVHKRNNKYPVVGIYFGGDRATEDDLAAVKSLQRTSSVIIPVVPKLENFSAAVPELLGHINGTVIEPADKQLSAICNLVLENLGLLRRARRIFISYKRTESATEALQIRHELDLRGFDVFLDTHSVPKGDAFQEVLWQRLADSDVVVLLDTPGFLRSRWTKEELAQAAAMTVGIIQVIWPSHQSERYAELCEPVYLQTEDFEAGGGLRPEALTKISLGVEQLRARSLAARHSNLITEFCRAAASVNIPTVVQPERFILARLPSGKNIAAVPAVGVPDALRYHEASCRFPVGDDRASEVLIIYDHRGLRPSWSAFLDWLDEFLPVKAVRVTSTVEKLTAR